MRFVTKGLAIGLALSLWMMSSSAYAVTPSNTLLVNTAKLTYSGNATGVTAAVTVTVELVPAAVTIAATFSAPSASVNRAENQSYSAIYTVQSNANGPDTYTVNAAYTATNDITGAAAPTETPGSITLGVTAAAATAASGQAVITVPADGSAGTAINELQADDTVIIGGLSYEILSVVDNASGTSTITLKSNLTSILAVGDAIYEYQSLAVDITDVGVQDVGAVFRLDLRTTVTSDSGSNPTYTQDVDINIVSINIAKYVRETSTNCVTPGCLAATTVNYNDGDGAETYYDTGVEAAPGELLEYLLVITTSSATITTALITDVLPAFTSYLASSTTLNAIDVDDEGAAPIFPLDSAADDGGLLIDDDGGRVSGTEGSGSVGTTQTVYVTYQISVDS